MIGKKFAISGMTIEVIAEQDEKWQVRNLTTQETLWFDKKVLDNAVKLGKAEEIVDAGSEQTP